MKRFLMATALTCLLSVVVLAGDVPTGDAIPPSPSRTTQTAPPVSSAALSLIQALIGLLAL